MIFLKAVISTAKSSSSACVGISGSSSAFAIVEMMAERGLFLAHTTIMRWIQHYVPEFEKRWAVDLLV